MAKFNSELTRFQNIPRDLVFDTTLSDRARFVYCFMACKPSEWNFFLEPMAKEIGYSVDTLRKYVNELVLSGWLEKGEQEREKGVFGATQYTLKANKNTDTVNFRHGKTPIQHNIDNIQTIDVNIEKEDNKLSSQKNELKLCNYIEIHNKWEETNPNLPSIRCFNEKRKKALRTLLKNNNATIEDLYKVFDIISACSFCQGSNDRGWTATLDWVLNDTKSCFNRLLEGAYAFNDSEKQKVQQIVNGVQIEQTKNEQIVINGVIYK